MRVNGINNTFLKVLEISDSRIQDNFSIIDKAEIKQPTNLDIPKRTISEASVNGIGANFDEYI